MHIPNLVHIPYLVHIPNLVQSPKLFLSMKDVGSDMQRLPQEITADGCAYCMVFYGSRTDYLLLALVLARRLARLGVKHPLIVLPTKDVPDSFREAFEKAGCLLQPPVEYMLMHPALLRSPQGRHCKVLTKLRCLGLRIPGLQKLLLIDSDILPRQSLDGLFRYRVPCAKLMPANLEHVWDCQPLQAGESVPEQWLQVQNNGQGARFNAGVVLLEPHAELEHYIMKEAHPDRDLVHWDGTKAPKEDRQERWEVVQDICGKPWNPTWTPDEDMLVRARSHLLPDEKWTAMGTAHNFEVQSELEYFPNNHMAQEHRDLCINSFDNISVLHFSGSSKPTWWAWYVAHGEMTVEEVEEKLQKQHKKVDPNHITAQATAEWLRAFEDLVEFASKHWSLDIIQLIGWHHKKTKK